jgi:hypothetical protein
LKLLNVYCSETYAGVYQGKGEALPRAAESKARPVDYYA